MTKEPEIREISFSSKNRGIISVFLAQPTVSSPNPVNIIFVMHGANRDPITYLQPWLPLVNKWNLFLVAPLFDKEHFVVEDYQQGGVITSNQNPNKTENTSFFVIEELLGFLKTAYSLPNLTYNIYGHSAGAQFVHRMILLYPNPRIKKAVAANAGWYTFPNFDVEYPHGLKNTGRTLEDITNRAFQRDLTILIGGQDTATVDELLRRDEETDKQGICRFTRAHNFLREAYYQYQKPIRWKIFIVPDVAHENEKIVTWIENNLQDFLISC